MTRLSLLSLAIVVLGCSTPSISAAQPQPARAERTIASEDDERLWRHYMTFTKGQDGPAEATAYRRRLVAEGMTEEQAWSRIFSIDRLRKRYRQAQRVDHFNTLYGSRQDVFDSTPNAFLASVVRDLEPGTALDVSMGQGRNTVFLATKGWKAAGFDPAEDGLARARLAAARAGVAIEAVNSTYEAFDFGTDRWNLVLFCYAFAPLSDPALVAKVYRALRPGGLVVVEHPMNEPDQAMHPHDQVNALVAAFGASLRIVFYEDTTGISEWQQSTVNRAVDRRRIVRLVARKEIR